MEFPPLDEAGEAMVQLFVEIGPCAAGPAGPVAQSWREIEAWRVLHGVALSAWQATALMRMSRAYVSAWHEAEASEVLTPPYQRADQAAERKDRSLGRLLENMTRAAANA